MSGGLFREKSLEKISSPEQINDYIKTSSPSIWLIFFSVLILIIGGAVWGIFGEVEITMDAVTVCENGRVSCYISESGIDEISENATVRIDGRDYELQGIEALPTPAADTISPYALHLAGFGEDEWVYEAGVDAGLEDGIYKTELVVESVSPVSLLMN